MLLLDDGSDRESLLGLSIGQVGGVAALLRSVRGLLVEGVRWNRLNSAVFLSNIPDLSVLRRKSSGKKDLRGILNRAETSVED
jgi:hypothetical protein